MPIDNVLLILKRDSIRLKLMLSKFFMKLRIRSTLLAAKL